MKVVMMNIYGFILMKAAVLFLQPWIDALWQIELESALYLGPPLAQVFSIEAYVNQPEQNSSSYLCGG